MKKILNDLFFATKYEIVRYFLAGCVTVAVNLGVYALLYHGLRWPLTISNVIAVALSILASFALNRFFVFRTQENKKTKTKREFISFIIVRLVSLAIEVYGVELLVGTLRWPSLLGKCAAAAVAIAFNFLMNIFVVFPDGCMWVKVLLAKIVHFKLREAENDDPDN